MDGVSVEEALEFELTGSDNLILKAEVSPDSSMLLTAAWGEPLKLWDLDERRLIDEVGGPVESDLIHDGDFHPTQSRLVVSTPPSEVRIHTLDIDELIEIAESRLTREMTEEECQQYLRSSCDEN